MFPLQRAPPLGGGLKYHMLCSGATKIHTHTHTHTPHTHTHVYIKGILLIVSTFSLSLCLATLSTEPLIFPTSSVRFSCPVVSDSPWPHGLQHARCPCPSPTPGAHSYSFHQVSDAIQPSHPLMSPSPLHSILPSISIVSNESVLCIRWPKD